MSTESPHGSSAGAASFHRLAVVSIVTGVIAFVLVVAVEPMLGVLLCFPAITSGVWGRREIAASDKPVRGFDLAGYGLALGVASLVLWVATLVLDATG